MTMIVMTAARTTKPPKTPSAMMPPMLSLAVLAPVRTELSAISLSKGFKNDRFVVLVVGFFVEEGAAVTVVWRVLGDE